MCCQLVLSLLFLFSQHSLLRKWLFHLVLLVILTWSIKGSLPGAYLVLEYHLSTLINVHFSSLVHWHFFFLFQGLGLKTNVPSYTLCVILCYLMISNFFNMLYPTQRTNAQKCRGEEQERKILTVRQETDNTSKSVDLVLVVQKSMSACVFVEETQSWFSGCSPLSCLLLLTLDTWFYFQKNSISEVSGLAIGGGNIFTGCQLCLFKQTHASIVAYSHWAQFCWPGRVYVGNSEEMLSAIHCVLFA